MQQVQYKHRPKVVWRYRKGARIFYVEYCEEGARKYKRVNDGACRCNKPDPNRPCIHYKMAQGELLRFEPDGAVPTTLPVTANFNYPPSSGPKQAVTAEPLIGDLQIGKLVELWKQDHSHGELDDSTLTRYSYGFHYLEEFCALEKVTLVSQLSEKLMKQLKLWMEKVQKQSDHYVNGNLRAVRAMFNWAIEEKLMAWPNPLSGENKRRGAKIISRTPQNKKERNPLTQEEVNRLFDNVTGWLLDMIIVFLYTGMRRGEVINLTFAQVMPKFIDIRAHDGWHPKQHEIRQIPMHPKVAEVIARRRVHAKSKYVFATSNHTRYDPDNIDRDFRKLFKEFNIVGEDGVGVTIHCFRHTIATKMLLDGIPPTVVRDLLGHKDLATTMIYYHRIQRRNTEFIENFSY